MWVFLLSFMIRESILREFLPMRVVSSTAVFLLCLILFTGFGVAQTASSSSAPGPTHAAASPANASANQGETTEYTLPPDKLAKSKALYDLSGRLRIIGTVWGFVVLLAISQLGGAREQELFFASACCGAAVPTGVERC
jgi:hypothetical protein